MFRTSFHLPAAPVRARLYASAFGDLAMSVNGPVRDADHYNGETYDARREMPGWDAPGFAARGWRRAVVVEEPERPHAALCGRIADPVRRQEVLPALRRTEPAPGRYVFDFGQNMVGVPRLALRGRPGAAITIRYAEMLNPDGTLLRGRISFGIRR